MAKQPVKARILNGFQDVLPAEAMRKEQMLSILKKVFFSFGYAPIETPHLEYSEVLLPDEGDEVSKQLYRFNDHGDRDVVLRYDLTVPFARYVVQHKNDLGIPFKRFAIGNVFRGERPQFGRYREFTQCDIDIVGTSSLSADAEIVEVIVASMQALGIERFTVKLNNRKILSGIAELVGAPERAAEIIRIIDKIDKIGQEKVKASLIDEVGLSAESADKILEFITIARDTPEAELFGAVESYKTQNALIDQGLTELQELVAIVRSLGISEEFCKVDFSLARGLGYYTGAVFETVLGDLPEIGSVCGGGRYDNLTMSYSKEQLPGIGCSVGLSRLLAALEKLGLQSESATPADILVAQMEGVPVVATRGLASSIRAEGVCVEVYPEEAKLKKQFQYADRRGHKFVIVLGSDEIENGTVTAKNLKTGEQNSYKSATEFVAATGMKGKN